MGFWLKTMVFGKKLNSGTSVPAAREFWELAERVRFPRPRLMTDEFSCGGDGTLGGIACKQLDIDNLLDKVKI